MNPIGFVKTDGGRSVSHPEEKLDCAVRAITCALKVPYAEVHNVFEETGRMPRHKSYRTDRALSVLKLQIIRDGMLPTVFQWIKNHQTGRYIVHIRDHMFAVENGTVLDLWPPKMKAKINWYIRVPEERIGFTTFG